MTAHRHPTRRKRSNWTGLDGRTGLGPTACSLCSLTGPPDTARRSSARRGANRGPAGRRARRAPRARRVRALPTGSRDRGGVAVGIVQPGGAAPQSRARRVGFGCGLDQDGAARPDQGGAPLQQQQRVAADADVAIGEQRMVPAALVGQPGEDVAVQHRAAPRVALPHRPPRAIHTEDRHAATHELGHQPTGPAAQIDRRASTAVDQPAVLAVGRCVPAGDGCRQHPAVVAHKQRGRAGKRQVERLGVGKAHRNVHRSARRGAHRGAPTGASNPVTVAANQPPGTCAAIRAASALPTSRTTLAARRVGGRPRAAPRGYAPRCPRRRPAADRALTGRRRCPGRAQHPPRGREGCRGSGRAVRRRAAVSSRPGASPDRAPAPPHRGAQRRSDVPA